MKIAIFFKSPLVLDVGGFTKQGIKKYLPKIAYADAFVIIEIWHKHNQVLVVQFRV
jgi:hypothetical protein